MSFRTIFSIICSRFRRFSQKSSRKKKLRPDKKPVRFSRRKHRRYRRHFKFSRKRPLKPISEYSIKEYLETDCHHHNELKVSTSDRMLNRLSKGWTLKETFGLRPEPKKQFVMSADQSKRLNDIILSTNVKIGQFKRHLDHKALITDFLTDVQIMSN